MLRDVVDRAVFQGPGVVRAGLIRSFRSEQIEDFVAGAVNIREAHADHVEIKIVHALGR